MKRFTTILTLAMILCVFCSALAEGGFVFLTAEQVQARRETDAQFNVTQEKRQYWYSDAAPAKYDREGNLIQYTVNPNAVDKKGNETTSITFSAQGRVREALVEGADGKTYVYRNGVWKSPKVDQNGNALTDKNGDWILTSSKAPAGYSIKDLNQYKLKVVQPKKDWFKNNTVCVRGLYLRDLYPGLTDKWYNVAPIDLTKQGRQTFDLVASNLYFVGYAYVDIQGDSVTVSYDYFESDLAEPLSESVALLTSVDQLTPAFLNSPASNIPVGRPVSINGNLGGIQTALLFICNRFTYSQPYTTKGFMLTRAWPNHPRYADELAEMKTLLRDMK